MDLTIFCDKEREYFAEPFSMGEHTYYTDGVIIVRTPKTVSKVTDVPYDVEGIAWPSEIPKGNYIKAAPAKVTYIECKACGGTGTVSTCPECKGEGLVYFETDFNDYECECETCYGSGVAKGGIGEESPCLECKGTGKEALPEPACEIDGVLLSNILLEKIQRLPGWAIYEKKVAKDMLYFVFNGGEGLVMGMRW